MAFAGGMKNLAKEGARLTLQISARLLQRLQDAAELRGIPLKQFVVQAAQRDADRIIGREKMSSPPEEGAPQLGADPPGAENNALGAAPEHKKKTACNDAPGDDAAGRDDRDCA